MINTHRTAQAGSSARKIPACVNRYTVFGGFSNINNQAHSAQPCLASQFTSSSQSTAHILGNSCMVIAGSQAALANIQRSDYANGTACFSSPVNQHDYSAGYHIECINNGVAVQLCGHGILATADYWLTATESEHVALVMGGLRIDVDVVAQSISSSGSVTDQDRPPKLLRARFAALKLALIELPDWLGQFDSGMRSLIISCAASESNDGYLVMEFAAGTDLGQLPPLDQRAAQFTQRAVLYVSAANEADVELGGSAYFPINLRYFAPQHGNDEDAATGSAARVAACYFYPRQTQLFIQQRSVEQGWLFTEASGEHIAVMGACQLLSRDVANAKAKGKGNREGVGL